MSIKIICDECNKELVTNDYFCCHDCLVRAIKNEKRPDVIAPCCICGKEVDGTVINLNAYDSGWWAHQECVDKLAIGFKK